MNNFTYSKTGLALTERFESCRLAAYQDLKGVWTIGYGHAGANVHSGMVVTQAQAEAYLRADIKTASEAINKLVTVAITQDEFDALVDFTFNVGIGALTSSTLLCDLNAGDIAGAAGRFEEWDHAGGQVVAGLLRRRLAEEALFNKGAE
jgi:lysozyme